MIFLWFWFSFHFLQVPGLLTELVLFPSLYNPQKPIPVIQLQALRENLPGVRCYIVTLFLHSVFLWCSPGKWVSPLPRTGATFDHMSFSRFTQNICWWYAFLYWFSIAENGLTIIYLNQENKLSHPERGI